MVRETVALNAQGSALPGDLILETRIETQERMGMVLDMLPVGLLIHQDNGIAFANQEACRMLHEDVASLLGRNCAEFLDQGHRSAFKDLFAEDYSTCAPFKVPEVRIGNGRGHDVCIQLAAARLPWEGPAFVEILLQDITPFKQKEAELQRLSMTDTLTGAFNRRYFIRAAEKEMGVARAAQADLSLMLLDVDHFKQVNDERGHEAGDAALKAVVGTCQDKLYALLGSRFGSLARLGGEEFVILLPHINRDQGTTIAETLRQAIQQAEIHLPHDCFGVTASFGVAGFRPDDTIDSLLRRADAALYRAKQSGRNKVAHSRDNDCDPPKGERITRARATA